MMADTIVYIATTAFMLVLLALLVMSLLLWGMIYVQLRRCRPLVLPYDWENRRDTRLDLETDERSDSSAERLPPLKQLWPAAIVAMLWISVALISQLTTVEKPRLEDVHNQLLGSAGISLLVLNVAGVLIGIPLAADRDRLQASFGFAGRNISAQIMTGCLGFVACLVPVYLMILVSFPFRTDETLHPYLKLLENSLPGIDVMLIVVTAVILAPLMEELLFRVLLQSLAEHFVPPAFAVALVAVLFAAVHGFPDSLAILPLGLILGYLFQRTRSYLAVVTLHACFNALNLMHMFVTLWAQDMLGLPVE